MNVSAQSFASPVAILWCYVGLRIAQHAAERWLAHVNRQYYLSPARQRDAQRVLGIADEDMGKSLAYASDKYRFAQWSGWASLIVSMAFLVLGGLGLAESWAQQGAAALGQGPLVTGLLFFGLLGAASMLLGLPLSYYQTFVIEQRHGFNRQTPRGFVLDRLKGLLLGVILGGLILALILWIMAKAGSSWWLLAWLAMSGFSILTAWLYPALLAPLFNKFTPVTTGELREQIDRLAARVGFHAGGIFIMDASKRSSHGNAYFTGVFGKKRIVLFDTLIDTMATDEVVAVLAHELGHFQLRHVRWALIRGVLMTGLTFYLLSLALPLTPFYTAFHLEAGTSYGALIVFGLWFGLLDFVLQPGESYLSRRNEFAADRFAKQHVADAEKLATALLKLREKSHALPLAHPAFSRMYYSHPPLLERLAALRAL